MEKKKENKNENVEYVVRYEKRSEEEKKALTRRINIVIGQLNGIVKMIEEDRHSEDILIQMASSANAIRSAGQEVLKGHITSYMTKELSKGNDEVVDEVFALFKNLK